MSTPTSPPQKVICSSAADIIAATPFLMGYTVTNSLVVLLLHNSVCRGAFRLALPGEAPLTEEQQRDIHDTIVGVIEPMSRVNEVALLFYTDRNTQNAAALPHADCVVSVVRSLEGIGCRTLHALCVTADSWADYTSPETNPPEGFPFDEVMQSPVALTCATSTNYPIDDIERETEFPDMPEPLHRAVVTRCARVSHRPREHTGVGRNWHDSHTVVARFYRVAQHGVFSISANQLAQLLGSLQREEHWFDLASCLAMGETSWQRQHHQCVERTGVTLREYLFRNPSGDLFPASQRQGMLVAVLRELGSKQPETELKREIARALGELASLAPDRLRPPLQALRAYHWWLFGVPSIARQLLSAVPAPPRNPNRVSLFDAVSTVLQDTPHPRWGTDSHRAPKAA